MKIATNDYFIVNKKIDKHKKLVAAYMEDEFYYKFLNSCVLFPDKIDNKHNYKIRLETKWIDQFGNSLNIEDKKAKIIIGDISLTNKKRIKSDIYYLLPINEMIKKSKLMYLMFGKINKRDYKEILLLGNDGILRGFLMAYGLTNKVSPLYFDMDVIRLMLENLPVDADEIKRKKTLLPAEETRHYLIRLPNKEAVMNFINEKIGENK